MGSRRIAPVAIKPSASASSPRRANLPMLALTLISQPGDTQPAIVAKFFCKLFSRKAEVIIVVEEPDECVRVE